MSIINIIFVDGFEGYWSIGVARKKTKYIDGNSDFIAAKLFDG